MAVNPMLNAGQNGIRNGMRGLHQAAHEIAELNLGSEAEQPDQPTPVPDGIMDAAESLVDLKVYTRQVQASAKVVETADAVIGMLIDTEV